MSDYHGQHCPVCGLFYLIEPPCKCLDIPTPIKEVMDKAAFERDERVFAETDKETHDELADLRAKLAAANEELSAIDAAMDKVDLPTRQDDFALTRVGRLLSLQDWWKDYAECTQKAVERAEAAERERDAAQKLADIRVVELHKITDEQARGYALMTEETRLRKAAERERDAALAEVAGLRATLESVKHYVQHIRVGPTDRMSLDEKQSAIQVICAALAALEKGE